MKPKAQHAEPKPQHIEPSAEGSEGDIPSSTSIVATPASGALGVEGCEEWGKTTDRNGDGLSAGELRLIQSAIDRGWATPDGLATAIVREAAELLKSPDPRLRRSAIKILCDIRRDNLAAVQASVDIRRGKPERSMTIVEAVQVIHEERRGLEPAAADRGPMIGLPAAEESPAAGPGPGPAAVASAPGPSADGPPPESAELRALASLRRARPGERETARGGAGAVTWDSDAIQ